MKTAATPAARRRPRWPAACFALPALLAAQSAPTPPAAEEVVQLEKFTVVTSLGKYVESMTSAGSKLPLHASEVPNTVQVLNANFLKDTLAQNLDDVYGYVVGMARVSTGATDFNLRGFTSNGAGLNLHNIQVDGLPGLTSRFGSPNTSNIERVEVLKGPASMLYGLINPGGMINLVTKVPQEKRVTTVVGTLSTYAGGVSSFGEQHSYSGTIDTTGAIDAGKRWLYRLVVKGEDRQSFRRNNFFENFYLYPSLTYRWSRATSLTLQGEIIREKRLADYVGLVVPFSNLANLPAFGTNYNNPTDYERDQGEALSTTFRHDFSGGWTLRLSARNAVNENGRRHLDFSSLTSATPVQNSTYRRIYRHFLPGRNNVVNFYDANAYGDLTFGRVKHTLLVGASYDYDVQATHRAAQGPTVAAINAYVTPAAVAYPADGTGAQDTRTTYRNRSVYFSDHLAIGEHWRPSFGLRYEAQKGVSRNNTNGVVTRGDANSIVPSVGLLYLASPALSLYASYSESFMPNSLTAFDANDRNGFDPETASQFEIGAKAELLGGKLNATLSLYDIHKENVLVATGTFTPAGNPISQLNGAERSKGVELQASWLPVPHWQFQAGVSYGDAKVTASTTPALVGSRILDSPRVTANLWTRYNIPSGAFRGLGFGTGVTHLSSRPTALTPIILPSITLVDTAVYYQWGRYHFAVNVANTLDRRYITSSSVNRRGLLPGQPRLVTLTVRANF